MNTRDLDDRLDALRTRAIYHVEGCGHSEQTKKQLSDLADKLEAAMDDEVPDEAKAAILDIGDLILRATLLPLGTSVADDLDLKLLKLLASGVPFLQ
jgi:hypothetical protein